MTRPPRAQRDRGSSTVELAVLTPVIILLGLLVIAAGRISAAHQAVDHAAAAAAREASLARTPTDAQRDATATARRQLSERDLACSHTGVTIDTAAFTSTPGQPGTVRVRVTCRVSLSDLTIPGLPGSTTLASTFSSPIDPLRGSS